MKTNSTKSPGSRSRSDILRRIAIMLKVLPVLVSLSITPTALAHEGGTDAVSCHNDREKIGFHCHARCEILLSFENDQEPPATNPHQAPAPQIYTAQILLGSIGMEVGSADGIFGPKTHKGVEVFQTGAGLPVDGQIDERLLAQIATVAQCKKPNLSLSNLPR